MWDLKPCCTRLANLKQCSGRARFRILTQRAEPVRSKRRAIMLDWEPLFHDPRTFAPAIRHGEAPRLHERQLFGALFALC